MVLILIKFNPALTLVGQIDSTTFGSAENLKLEVLESGDSLEIGSNRAFKVTLPTDTIWNICLKSTLKEKCYEIVYTGPDSSFTTLLGNQGYIIAEFFKDVTDSLKETQLDTLNLIEQSDTNNVQSGKIEEGTVTLKKVLLRVRKVPKRSLGKSTVSAKLIKRQPGLGEADVLRSIQNLPGVVASSDFSSKIYVRGGGADQNLFLLDNGVVFSPVHLFGLFSTFLVEGLENVDFYKGGFSTRYGNRLSSVVDIKPRKGGDTLTDYFHKGSLKISTFATQTHIEGSVENFRYLWAGRITYLKQILDALRWADVTSLNLDYFFYDLQTYLHYQIDPDQSVSLMHYGGKDNLALTVINLDWGNQVLPINYNLKVNENLKIHALIAYSYFDQSFGLENIFTYGNNIKLLTPMFRGIYKLSDEQTLDIGIEAQFYSIKFAQDIKVVNIKLSDNSRMDIYSAFLQHSWNLAPFNFDYGLRINFPTTLKELGFEPRAGMSLDLGNNQSVDLHLGYYLQYINSVQFSDQETINEFYYPAKKIGQNVIRPSSNILLSTGYSKSNLWDKYAFTLESYYKSMDNLLGVNFNQTDTNSSEDADKKLGEYFTSGHGYSMGYEISFRKEKGWAQGGISWAQGYSASVDDGIGRAYNPKWHQPWSFKADAGFSWRDSDGRKSLTKKGRYLRSSTQIKYGSGLPYTDYDSYVKTNYIDQNEEGVQAGGPNPSFPGNFQVQRGNRNAELLKPYFRWDVKVIDWGREGKWNFSWTIINITNNENIFLPSFDTSQNPPKKNKITQFPLFPLLLNYEYYF